MNELGRERFEETLGFGNGLDLYYSNTLKHNPIPGSMRFYVVGSSILDDLIEPECYEPVEEDLIESLSGPLPFLMIKLLKRLPDGCKLVVTYEWVPPRLRGAQVLVKTADGRTEWTSLVDLADALNRGL